MNVEKYFGNQQYIYIYIYICIYIFQYYIYISFQVSLTWHSNPQPSNIRSDALPTELRALGWCSTMEWMFRWKVTQKYTKFCLVVCSWAISSPTWDNFISRIYFHLPTVLILIFCLCRLLHSSFSLKLIRKCDANLEDMQIFSVVLGFAKFGFLAFVIFQFISFQFSVRLLFSLKPVLQKY